MRIDLYRLVQIEDGFSCLVKINMKQSPVDEQIGVLWIKVNALVDELETVLVLESLEED